MIMNGKATWQELEMIQVLVEKVVRACGKREKYTTVIQSLQYKNEKLWEYDRVPIFSVPQCADLTACRFPGKILYLSILRPIQ